MATSTTYDLYPVQQFKDFDAWYQALPVDFIQKGLIKFGTDKNGKTIFEYTNGPNHVYQPAIPSLGWKEITDKQWMENTLGYRISDDGRSLVSTVPAGKWNIMGVGSESKYVINGSGADETVSSYGASPSSTTAVFTSPIMGAGNVSADQQFNYLHQFTKFAQGVQQNVKSRTVTDSGILGDISNFVKSLGPIAPIALSFVMPGVGSAIGSALGVSGAVGSAIGNTLLQTTLNGGDLGKALTSAIAGYAGAEMGGLAKSIAEGGGLGEYLQLNPAYAGRIAQAVTTTAIQGGDLETALKNATLNVSTDAATSNIPGFADLPPAAQNTIKASIQAELQGKNVNVEGTLQNAAINGLTSYALNEIPDYKNLDSKTQSLIANQLSTALRGGDMTANATKWAINQANQDVYNALNPTPASEINQILDMPATPATPEPVAAPSSGDFIDQLIGLTPTADTAPMTQEEVNALVGLPPAPEAAATTPEAAPVPEVAPAPQAPATYQEAAASDEFYRSIGIEPSSMTDTAPMSQEDIDALLVGAAPEKTTATTGALEVKTPGQTAATAGTTQTTPTATEAAQTAQKKPQFTTEDLLSLLDLTSAIDQAQQAQGGEESPYANIDLSAPEFAGLDYLGDIGEIPQYLGSLTPESEKTKPTRYIGAGGGRGGQGGPTASELAKYYRTNISNLSDADVAQMLKGSEGLISTFGPTNQAPAGNPYSRADILKGIASGTASNLESLVRGGLSAIPGAAGDIESLMRGMFGGGSNVLPTSSDIRGMVPRVIEPRMETSGMEMMGEAMSPLAGKGVTAASGGIKDLMRGSTFEQEMADILARSGQPQQVSQYASNLWDPNKSSMVGNQLVNLSSDPNLPASSQRLISQALENVLAGNSRAALNLVIDDPILGPKMSKYLSGQGFQAYETLPGSTLSTKRYLTPTSGGYYNPVTGRWE